ncbi:DUF1772 domain-containing protein [Dongia deserti]|uniref:DUF1772 domain-containing protein n=1 Tax=Dongia deserti TaxID=2268030 RepID=UPI0013C4E19F|nr:DUF1772 domain-containing protein [Dongia deserti]
MARFHLLMAQMEARHAANSAGHYIGAIVATMVLLAAIPPETPAYLLTLAALIALIVMHVLYWVLTHPVNKFWLGDQKLGSAGAAFFNTPGAATVGEDWARLRDRWEYSHVARAGCAFIAFVTLAAATAF